MYPHAMPVRFLEQAIVSSMRKVESEEEGAVAQDAFSNKVVRKSPPTNEVVAADVEGPCSRQEEKRGDVVEATDPQRRT